MSRAAPRWGKAVAEASAAGQAAAAGFDYVAVSVDLVMEGDDGRFALQKKMFRQCRMTPEVCLSALPAGVTVAAPGFNIYYWLGYLKRALRRLADMGCHTLLWRDGAARALPLEGDKTAAKGRCLQFVYMLCRLCEEHGIAVVIEPLSAAKTNHLNTVREVELFIAQVNKKNLRPAIGLADADALCGDAKFEDIVARLWHICVEELPPPAAAPLLQKAGGRCLITLLGEADGESLQRARQLATNA